jgi:hypothetical protein
MPAPLMNVNCRRWPARRFGAWGSWCVDAARIHGVGPAALAFACVCDCGDCCARRAGRGDRSAPAVRAARGGANRGAARFRGKRGREWARGGAASRRRRRAGHRHRGVRARRGRPDRPGSDRPGAAGSLRAARGRGPGGPRRAAGRSPPAAGARSGRARCRAGRAAGAGELRRGAPDRGPQPGPDREGVHRPGGAGRLAARRAGRAGAIAHGAAATGQRAPRPTRRMPACATPWCRRRSRAR